MPLFFVSADSPDLFSSGATTKGSTPHRSNHGSLEVLRLMSIADDGE